MLAAHCFLLVSWCWESSALRDAVGGCGWVWGAFAPPAHSSASSQDAAARMAVLEQCILGQSWQPNKGDFSIS